MLLEQLNPPLELYMDESQVIEYIESLSDEERRKLLERFCPSVGSFNFLVGGGCSDINNSFIFQLNGNSDDILKQLELLSPENMSNLFEAFSKWVQRHKPLDNN